MKKNISEHMLFCCYFALLVSIVIKVQLREIKPVEIQAKKVTHLLPSKYVNFENLFTFCASIAKISCGKVTQSIV